MIDIKNKYHVALDDTGLILRGVPENPVYEMSAAPLYTSRFAQGDRTYDDFSKWWYWVQTDWFNGLQTDREWKDNAKFYASQNIDTFSEPGVLKLHRTATQVENFDSEAICFAYGTVGGNDSEYFGGDDGIYTDGTTSPITNSPDDVRTLYPFKDYLWSGSWQFFGGIDPDSVVVTYDDSTFTDQTANIETALGWAPHKCTAIEPFASGIYIGVSGENNAGIVNTSVANPTTSGDYSVAVSIPGSYRFVSMKILGGDIVYLLTNNTQDYSYLFVYNIASDTNTLLREFKGVNYNTATGNRYIIEVTEGLIVVAPNSDDIGGELWLYDGSTFTRVYQSNSFKEDLYGDEQAGYFTRGGIGLDGKAYLPGIIYDSGNIHNGFLDIGNSDALMWGIGVSKGGNIYLVDNTDNTIVYEKSDSSNYRSSTGNNWLVFNKFSKVAGIPKLAYSMTIIFDKFDVGESIELEYNIDDITDSSSWNDLGTASYANDGGEITEKTFYFPENTKFRTIWIRVKMDSDGSSTPRLNDTVMEYSPAPTQDKRWKFRVDCSDSIELLSGQKQNEKGREIRGRLLKTWLSSDIVDFQDVDFAMCNLTSPVSAGDTTISVDDTSEFPEAGRLRIDNEVIYYSGKTQTSFTGCTRGEKETDDSAHSITQSSTGTISSSGSTVTGSGTAFITELQVGDMITADSQEFQVIEITSDTSLKIDGAPTTDWSNDSFTINPSVNNSYQVIVEEVGNYIPTLNNERELEYVALVTLREVM